MRRHPAWSAKAKYSSNHSRIARGSLDIRQRGDAVTTSTMQDFPLTTTAIMRHGGRVHGASECVTWTETGPRRASFAEVVERADRLAGALARLGSKPGDRVGTL